MQAFSVPAVFKAIDRFTQPLKQMSSSVNKFAANADTKLQRVNRSLKKLTPTMGRFTKQALSMAGAFLIATAVQGSIKEVNSYKENIASLQAITGASDIAMVSFKSSIKDVGIETKKSNAVIAKAFEIVGSAKPELLSSADALGKVTKAAVILSQASGDELESSALSLTGVMNQFNLQANKSERVMNALAAGSVAGSANITNIAASMKNFGAVANASNLSVEKAIALVEVMGAKSIFAEEAGTKLSAAMLNLKKAGLGYASGQFNVNDALKEAKARMDRLTTAKARDAYMNKIFGKTGITAGTILVENISQFEQLTKAVTGTNTAVDQAALKQATLAARAKSLRDKFFNMAIGAEENSGAFAKMADIIGWLTDNLDMVVKVVGIAIGILAALKVVIGAITVVSAILNATWLLNPITWIVLGIIAVITGVILLIKNWGKISEWLSEKWQAFADFFKRINFVAMFRNIGASIIRYMIWPLTTILKLMSKLPGKVGEMARNATAGIDAILGKISGDDPVLNPKVPTIPTPLLNPKKAADISRTESQQSIANTLGININDRGGNISSIDNPSGIPINLTPSLGGAF